MTLVSVTTLTKKPFGGRQLLVEYDPCMLPTPFSGIFFKSFEMVNNKQTQEP